MDINNALAAHYFELLGLDSDASIEECEREYRNIVVEVHPDRFSMNDPRRVAAEENTKELAVAIEKIRSFRKTPMTTESFDEQYSKALADKIEALPVKVTVKKP